MTETVRRLAAVMFTDVVGYTALTQADESGALRLLSRHHELIRPVFARFRGREVKTIGDSFLVEFESALDAVNCAIDVQRVLHEYNRTATEGGRIHVRVGIHLGDVVHANGDVLGDAVNLASRIEHLADPGGVCLSAQVFAQVENKLPYPLQRLGPRTLKNVRLPVEVYRIELPWESPPALSTESTPGRLAVLPFVNMSPEPSDEYFADGMTEELIGKLSEIRDLKVIARTSVMNYKHQEKRLADIGKELGVDSLIEGSVRRSGKQIRVRVQLVDAHTEENRWASNYDKELTDIFAIQGDIASNVAEALDRSVFRRSPPQDTVNVEAYTSYLRGLQLLHEDTLVGLREALAQFDRAVTRDPRFARAYAGLARTWVGLVLNGQAAWEAVRGRAEPNARRSIELGPWSAEAHAAMSEVHWLLDRFPDSLAEAEKAIEIDPNLAEAHESLGRQYVAWGELNKALLAYRRAHELDPLSVRIGTHLSWAAQQAGREDEARALLENLDGLHPGDTRVLGALAEFYALRGDIATAERLLTEGVTAHPKDSSLASDLATLYAYAGRRPEAEEALRRAEGLLNDTGKLQTRLYFHAALGNLDAAFEALTHLAESHAWPHEIALHPGFRALREDPRYGDFQRSVGLLT